VYLDQAVGELRLSNPSFRKETSYHLATYYTLFDTLVTVQSDIGGVSYPRIVVGEEIKTLAKGKIFYKGLVRDVDIFYVLRRGKWRPLVPPEEE
jgi:hypothetical protein